MFLFYFLIIFYYFVNLIIFVFIHKKKNKVLTENIFDESIENSSITQQLLSEHNDIL